MLQKKLLHRILWILCLMFTSISLLVGFVPQREGAEVRRSVHTHVAQLRPEDFPTPIVAMSGGWAIRATVTPPDITPLQTLHAKPEQNQLIAFVEDDIQWQTTHGNIAMGQQRTPLTPLLPLDGTPETARLSCNFNHEAISLPPQNNIPLKNSVYAGGDIFTRAKAYGTLVEQFSQRFGLSPALVYAIIQTESNFSPVLVSSRSAMGLMQLLPSTAGGEVHTFLHGVSGRVNFAELSNPETNIRYGTAYLHLLLQRHLGDIKDPLAREYCAVAAYNMGPNGFLRIFSADRDKAIEIINTMTAEQVLHRLTTQLPIHETRSFVAKVTRRRGEFAAFLENNL